MYTLSFAKRWATGLVNFVAAIAFNFFLALPSAELCLLFMTPPVHLSLCGRHMWLNPSEAVCPFIDTDDQ